MKNLERLKKQNVRFSEPKASPATLSLESLRRVSGGAPTIYIHLPSRVFCYEP